VKRERAYSIVEPIAHVIMGSQKDALTTMVVVSVCACVCVCHACLCTQTFVHVGKVLTKGVQSGNHSKTKHRCPTQAAYWLLRCAINALDCTCAPNNCTISLNYPCILRVCTLG